MSFFQWFSRKTPQRRAAADLATAQFTQAGNRSASALPQAMKTEMTSPEDRSKIRRHARREQMYVAIREAMTRAGVLSASYRFKVLSLDPGADAFLIMMDLQSMAGGAPPQLSAIELLIMQSARVRFDITVSAVYWRVHEAEAIRKLPLPPADPPSAVPIAQRFEPVRADEVTAFQQALFAASAHPPGAASETGVKTRGWLRQPAPRLDDFEDTEVTEAESSPVLSTTQYGELN